MDDTHVIDSQVSAALREFVICNFLFGDVSRTPANDDALLEAGILDSTGVLELIEFLESEFEILVDDTETLPENLGSITSLTRYVLTKQSAG